MKTGKMFLFIGLTAALGILHAAGLDLEKDYRREIALYHIRPNQAASLKRDPNGTPVSETRLKEAVRDFYDWLYPLDPAFLKRFQIKNIVFKDTVYDYDGDAFQHRKEGDTLYLDADLDDRQFYVSLFYLQLSLMPRTYLNRWNKINPDGFSYENMRGTLSGNAQKKLDAVLAKWDKYFVNRSGMYSTEMDMALTFAYMIEKGPDATRFVKKNSPDVQKKFDLIIDILESVKAADRGYMQTLLADDLSKLKSYVPYALSVRLEREYSGAWSALEDDEETDGNTAKPQTSRKIGDPVEVAGRKLNPLILSLETKNDRLFELLMQNKVNPNVANDKKVSALRLAITNNDPKQVKALLAAGAKVTQDIAHAGTAAGVNAEIVKMMNAYLPGVRQSEKPKMSEKPEKKTNSSSGDTKKAFNEMFPTREMTIDKLELEQIDLKNMVELIQSLGQDLDPDFRVVLSESDKIKKKSATIVAENATLYDLLCLLCADAGLEMRIDVPNKTVTLSPDTGKAATGKKNDPTKKKK